MGNKSWPMNIREFLPARAVSARMLALWVIRFYQGVISPYFPPCCRYVPSCSAYAYEAVQKYGICRGFVLTLKRLLRCHPFCPGGYDPVP